MSLQSKTSRIIEKVNATLLDVNEQVSVEIINNSSKFSEFETISGIKNPFDFDPRHFLPNCEIMDLDRFVEVAAELIQDAQDREGTVASEQVTLVEDYPAERFDRFGDEVIAWKLIKRSPANMSADGKSRPQQGFTSHYKVRLPKYPNKWLDVEARPLDHIIEFQCWSKSARIANRRALWLERLFVNHSWAFIAQGADRMRFLERLADWYVAPSGQHLYVRPLRFAFRAFEFRVKADPLVTHIAFEVGSVTSDEL